MKIEITENQMEIILGCLNRRMEEIDIDLNHAHSLDERTYWAVKRRRISRTAAHLAREMAHEVIQPISITGGIFE